MIEQVKLDQLQSNPTDVVGWIEQQCASSHVDHSKAVFGALLSSAAQPRSASGNACVKLCGFVDQASRSSSPDISHWAFTEDVSVKLFNFFVEWNESEQHRSMRLVLDLVTKLIARNPAADVGARITQRLLHSLISILLGQSTKPVAKSAIKTLDFFVSKETVSLESLRETYIACHSNIVERGNLEIWRLFFHDVARWMRVQFVCASAGRFLVTMYRRLRMRDSDLGQPKIHVHTWHGWVLELLESDLELIEPVKNYLFLPMFKSDRHDALVYLRRLNSLDALSLNQHGGIDSPALLQLAALETGKKLGLVDEPALSEEERGAKDSRSVVLQIDVLEEVLSHPSADVRSLAFSLVITSASTTRPYSLEALQLIQKYIPTYFCDADPKFRVDVLGKARDMYKRIRGSTLVLNRSVLRARVKSEKPSNAEIKPVLPTEVPAGDKSSARKLNLVSLPETQMKNSLAYHKDFLKWYISFLCHELSPTASYQRHISALRVVDTILRLERDASNQWASEADQEMLYDLFDQAWGRVLFDLTVNPFDDVRETSSTVISSMLSSSKFRRLWPAGHQTPMIALRRLLFKADEKARITARADLSDGVARIRQLVYELSVRERHNVLEKLINNVERSLSIAEAGLGPSALDAPLHSDFSSLRMIWVVVTSYQLEGADFEIMQHIQERLISTCERAWQAVSVILCDDSPEGHLPQELEEFDGLDTKDLLSYSFRAVHESSNLMRTMILAAKNTGRPGLIHPSSPDFERLGNLAFTQLSRLRHRGALSTVSLTFASCCQHAKFLRMAGEGQHVVASWYQGAIDAIFTELSITRRSAGIPFLVAGVLSANLSEPSFEQVMTRLMGIASMPSKTFNEDGIRLPQVHAFNCLKEIFKSSLLTSMGNKAEKFLPQCLDLATSGLKSETWAIRNCGLVLLRSLIDCLFGSHESKAMIEVGWDGKANRIAYHRYPNLPGLIVSLLKSGHEAISTSTQSTAGAEAVFPALDMIRRAGPPDEMREELQGHIAIYLGSPVWHVREMAARTLCSCLFHDQWLETLSNASSRAFHQGSINYTHGILLCFKFVCEHFKAICPQRLIDGLDGLEALFYQADVWTRYRRCPDVLAAYLDVINHIVDFKRVQGLPLTVFSVPVSVEADCALLRIQRIEYHVKRLCYASQPVEPLSDFLRQLGSDDSRLAALETLDKHWDLEKHEAAKSFELCYSIINTCDVAGSPAVKAAALLIIAKILDTSLALQAPEASICRSIFASWHTLRNQSMSPLLINAALRASGSILAFMHRREQLKSASLTAWAHMVAEGGLDDQSFDTRLAAAEGVAAFFIGVGATCNSDEYLPVLVSLYDILNDDDEGVRAVGAVAVKHIVGRHLTPVQAADTLLAWLASQFPDSVSLRYIIIERLVGQPSNRIFPGSPGTWISIGDRIAEAMQANDLLFAVEEQNLFVDEVREVTRWLSVFESLKWNMEEQRVSNFRQWVMDGLAEISRRMTVDDGPMGWTSDPHVFAVCAIVIFSAGALSKASSPSAGVELRGALGKLKAQYDGHDDLEVNELLRRFVHETRL